MSGKRKKGKPEPLALLIGSSFKGTALGERLKELEIWQKWDSAVGPAIAGRARPLRYSSGLLTVQVANSAWMQQLSFMKSELRERLNSLIGDDRIKEITLKSGKIKIEENLEEEPEIRSKELSNERSALIDSLVEEIRAEELKEAVKGLMESHYRFGKVEG